eukprot:c22514_g1_i1 orf=358-1233(+)
MGQRSMQLTIVSAKDLQSGFLFGKDHPFAVAFIHPSDRHRTKVAVDGGSNPYWNEKLNLPLDESVVQRGDAVLTIEIYSRRGLGDKIIGTVHIPVVDIIKDSEDGSTKFVTYQVRRPSGRTQGSLIVIAKVVGELHEFGQSKALYPTFIDGLHSACRDNEQSGANSFEEPVMAYPAYGSTSNSEEKQPQPYVSYPPQYPPIPDVYPPPHYLTPHYPPYPAAPQYAYQSYPQDSYYPAAPYTPVVVPPQRPQTNRIGNLGLGAGLLGGALGGLLLGDLVNDMSYDPGGWGGF